MVLFRPARPSETAAQKELWRLAFGDSEAYINYFFDCCGPHAQSMVLEEDGELRGATQLLPLSLRGADGKRYRCAYVYGVCIHPEHQGQGLGRAMASYADFYLQEKGFDCAVTVPADEGLHRFYALQGFGECFRHRQFQVEGRGLAVRAGSSVRRCGGAEYALLREELLKNTLHVSYSEELLNYQWGLCENSGGGLFVLQVEGGLGCACVEGMPDGGAMVKELLLPPGLEETGVAVLASELGERSYTVRVPDSGGTPFGMLRWYRNDIAFDWDWVNTSGYLGLAFD